MPNSVSKFDSACLEIHMQNSRLSDDEKQSYYTFFSRGLVILIIFQVDLKSLADLYNY